MRPLSHGVIRYYWLRERAIQVELPPPRKVIPPREIDLLLAMFTVNRSAKRYRDAAQRYYQLDAFNFASAAKRKKLRLYDLKDRGIAAAYRNGRITYEGTNGHLSLFRGEGYVFHSTLEPIGVEGDEEDSDSFIRVDSQPKSAKEARLSDAIFTLSLLSKDYADFEILDAPQIEESVEYCHVGYYHDDVDDWDEDDDYCQW